jgi:hypothetical protein
MTAPDDASKFLSIYLEDHVAGATAGSQRAARLADAEADSADGAALAKLAADIAADRDALLAMMEAMGVEPSRLKNLVASVGEKLGTLKLNGRVAERSPLSTVVEVEALQMAVRGKRSLWEALQVAGTAPATIDLDGLIARADDQASVLDRLHRARVAATFSAEPERPRS